MSRNGNGPTMDSQDRAAGNGIVFADAPNEPRVLRHLYVVRWWNPVDDKWRSKRFAFWDAAQRQLQWARQHYGSDVLIDEAVVTETRRVYFDGGRPYARTVIR